MGNASYPKDADNYDDLLALVDKALYRGKTKGRNCYITYVKEKHENLDVHKKGSNSLHVLYRTLNDIVKLNEKRDVLIKYLLNNVTSILGVSQSIFVKTDGYTISSDIADEYETPEIYNLLIKKANIKEEFYSPSSINDFSRTAYKEIREWIEKEKVLTFFISEVKDSKGKMGDVILIEKNVQRIWQDSDKALVMYVDRLIEILYK